MDTVSDKHVGSTVGFNTDSERRGAAMPKVDREGRDGGFTLIELLIVIVILGVLSTVVVFAVRGINNNGQESACSADRSTVEIALEAYFAQNLEYPADTDTVDNGWGNLTPEFLRNPSTLHSYNLEGENPVVTPIGDCAP
jgi:general secretion pathway protein G